MPLPAWRTVARWLLVLPIFASGFVAAHIGCQFLLASTRGLIPLLDASSLGLPISALLFMQLLSATYIAGAIWLVPTAWAIGFALRVHSRVSCAFGLALALVPVGALVWVSRAFEYGFAPRIVVLTSALLLVSALLLFWCYPAHRKLYVCAIPLALLLLFAPTVVALASSPALPSAPQQLWSVTLQNNNWDAMNTGSEFSATRQVVIAGDRLIAVYDAGSAPYQGKQPMSNYRLVSLDIRTGKLRNEKAFVGKWGAIPELYATIGNKVIVASGSLRELNLDLTETGRHFEIDHGRIDQMSPDGSTMAWETFPGVELVDTSTLAILPTHIDASIAGSITHDSILTNNLYWVRKYPADHGFVTKIDGRGEHLIFHDGCSGGAEFLSEQRIFLAGCGKIRILDPSGTILHESALTGNPRFAGVSRNGKRFAIVTSDSMGDPPVVLYEHFTVFDTETARPIAMIRSRSLPDHQSWSAFSADGSLFAAGSPDSLNLYQLPDTASLP
jgi:hypothetical protein